MAHAELILENMLSPHCINIAGPCFFNGKQEEKATEQMVLGILYEKFKFIFEKLSMDELIEFVDLYSPKSMLDILKERASRIM